MESTKYIPIDKCKDRHLYIISARNADIGVYLAEKKAFKISRFIYSNNLIDMEYHCDIDPTELVQSSSEEIHGTVKPLAKLKYIGATVDDEDKLKEVLNYYMKTLYYDIKEMKKVITIPIILIDSDRLKRLRAYNIKVRDATLK